ncbi:trypsin-like peptidase domain-containing protein [Actinosynnema sp. NPDC047251]|uniref:S1C family serine protease n=1 Tax=Saccharothrix espanaensis TaxID=103731 RepID=UPI00030779D7|nr:trypsin-like peptidase domain-containing protein [Saccharothrix espanaensis]
MDRHLVTRIGVGVACAAVIAGCTPGDTASTGGAQATTIEASAAASSLEQGYEQVVHDTLPSVVQINTEDGLGSGVLYDDKGHIVTNAHVVGRETRFQVSFANDSTPRSATLVASHPPEDLAVIKVDGSLPSSPAKFGDSGRLRVGQLVLAMGNPLGLSSSVSNGIVSALGRTVAEPASAASPGTTIADMIQTSAAINPGNSGGALVDMSGAVIGIPTLAATDQQLGGAAPGIGFAISVNTVKRIADQIIRDGKVTESGRAALGITGRTVIDRSRKEVGVGVVTVVDGGAAQKAGIRAGDVITEVGDTATPAIAELNRVLAARKPGDRVPVEVLRGTGNTTIDVVLGEL